MRVGWIRFFALAALGVFCVSHARADEVSDQIKEGLELYQKGSYSEAVGSLNYAIGQIQQEQASALKKLFPGPLSGWKANEAEGDFASAVIMGGGITASRHYYVEESGKTVDIEYLCNSPMMQSVMMFLTNPAFVGQEPGSKLLKIKGYKGVQKFSKEDRYGELSLVVQSKMLITLKGSEVGALDELLSYANTIPFEELEKFLGK
jgi:hypothetical protein